MLFKKELDFIRAVYPEWTDYSDFLIIAPEDFKVFEDYPEAEGSEVFSRPDWVFHEFITAYAYYYVMRLSGSEHRFAEMIVMRKPSRGMTDDIFFSRFPMLGDQFRNEAELMTRVNAARAMGYNPSHHDVYMPGLANCVGDPNAWVSRATGRTHIQKVLEERGWGSEGHWDKTPRQEEDSDCIPLAEDVVQQEMAQKVASNPDLVTLDRRELREKVIEEHGMPQPKT